MVVVNLYAEFQKISGGQRVGHFDPDVVTFLNSFAHRSWGLDKLANFFIGNELAKGDPVIATVFFAWFQLSDTTSSVELARKRQILLHTLFVCVPAILLARLLAWALPFRERPIHDPALHLRVAYTFDSSMLIGWSSFPSDHAVLFFAIATGMYLVNRKVGLILYAHAILVISLPRIYLGIHYPSDILAGALFGIAAGYTAAWPALRLAVTRPAAYIMGFSSGLFYACFFMLTRETAQLYDPLRYAAGTIWRMVRQHLA